MSFFKTIERISRLHYFIKEECTGKPEILSTRLGISRSSLYNIIDELKSYDAPIDYSRRRETFYYTKTFELSIHCSISVIENDIQLKKIVGGMFLPPSYFLHGRLVSLMN